MITRKKAAIFTPGEMVTVKLPREAVMKMDGDITVCLEGGDEDGTDMY